MLNYFIILFYFLLQVYSTNTKEQQLLCGKKYKTSGKCGNNCQFVYYHIEKKLVIDGDRMEDYISPLETPWYLRMKEIQTVEISNIKSIGDFAFFDAVNLENVVINEGV